MKKIAKRRNWRSDYLAREAEIHLWRNRHQTLVLNTHDLELRFKNLVETNQALLRRIASLESSPRIPHVDPQAEVVMGMKRAVEYSINTSAALLDAVGELVDQVSGRKARRDLDQGIKLDRLIGNDVEDPSR